MKGMRWFLPKEAPEIPPEHPASIPKHLFVKGLGVVLERVHPSFLSWYNQLKNAVPRGKKTFQSPVKSLLPKHMPASSY